jgi:hypothetical protein
MTFPFHFPKLILLLLLPSYTLRSEDSPASTTLHQTQATITMHSLAYIFLQLWLTAVAYAAPIEASGGSLDTYAPGVGGVLGFIVLVLDILVFSSSSPPTPSSCLPR